FGFLRRVASDSTLCLEPFVIRQGISLCCRLVCFTEFAVTDLLL
ncbi:hypothetical protein A2U01_0050211, partial [Trifolium medium]|nr:hypothetical protein [Trifolium medium]